MLHDLEVNAPNHNRDERSIRLHRASVNQSAEHVIHAIDNMHDYIHFAFIKSNIKTHNESVRALFVKSTEHKHDYFGATQKDEMQVLSGQPEWSKPGSDPAELDGEDLSGYIPGNLTPEPLLVKRLGHRDSTLGRPNPYQFGHLLNPELSPSEVMFPHESNFSASGPGSPFRQMLLFIDTQDEGNHDSDLLRHSLQLGLRVCFFNRHHHLNGQGTPLHAFDTVHWDEQGQVHELRDLMLAALPQDLRKDPLPWMARAATAA